VHTSGILATLALLLSSSGASAADVVTLDPIVVTAPAQGSDAIDTPLGAREQLDDEDLSPRRGGTADTGQLLLRAPGVQLQSAGGISSQPVIQGLSDDRLRIQVDGADLVSACPNHMNAPLSYVAPARIGNVKVFGAVAPVSVGGDSIGGTIQVNLAPPAFAGADQQYLARGEIGSFYQSNGNALGYNLLAAGATRWLSLSYAESSSRSDNYSAGGNFKPASAGREGGRVLAGDEVGSSAYRGATSRALGLALRRGGHLAQLDVSRQTVDFEGFPNQRMDMTGNDNWLVGLRYEGQFGWGDLVARLGYQGTRHTMDMGPDRYSYGTGMPMDTKAKNRVASVQGSLFVSDKSLLRTGVEYQSYTLYDWWPAVGGVMGPNDFWNVDYGRRRRFDLFAEWESSLSAHLTAQAGVRSDMVSTDAAAVQGYNNGLANAWGNDAAWFNGQRRGRDDYNWDMTGLFDYSPGPRQSYQAGYSRRSRSPNLYQRYAWSTNPMAALMNNFIGDGNGYVGNLGLLPEIANSASVTGHWHDSDNSRWDVKATAYYTYVRNYIDAKRCDVGQCSSANVAATQGFVLLQYVHQNARLHGADLSGRLVILSGPRVGRIEASGMVSYVRGRNLASGDNLYGIMPLHGRFSVDYRLGPWSLAPEIVAVAAKQDTSLVRNEVPTNTYWLLNLRSSVGWKHLRADISIENILDRLYANPLGGAYVGQGASMTTNGVPWGVAVPGRGRSINCALRVSY
jgi:iron complex outermembrane recepter protein